MPEIQKKGGGKLSRSETVTIRLDPKMRYLAELASRIHRRSLSSYVEWAIDESFSHVLMPNMSSSVAELAGELWDVDEPDRFVTLATKFPNLLTHEEQKRWKLIRENGYLWRGRYADDSGEKRWTWDPNKPQSLVLARLRESWDAFVAVAKDEAPPSALPGWPKVKPVVAQAGKAGENAASADKFQDLPGALNDEDDDLPF
jgi:hypothetical protein